jgi:hypothetical protein
VLAALSGPADGRLARVVKVLFEGVTLGAVSQEVVHPATGYLAFATLVLFMVGLALLPGRQISRSIGGRSLAEIGSPRALADPDLSEHR